MYRIPAGLPIGPSDRGYHSNSYRRAALFNSAPGQPIQDFGRVRIL